MVGVDDENLGDEILFPRRHAGAALAAAALCAVGVQGDALDVARVTDGDDHVLALDQVFVVLNAGVEFETRTPRVREPFLDLQKLLAQQRDQRLAVGENVQIHADLRRDRRQILTDLVTLEPGQPLQSQF